MNKEYLIQIFKDLKEYGGITKLNQDYDLGIEKIKALYSGTFKINNQLYKAWNLMIEINKYQIISYNELKKFINTWINAYLEIDIKLEGNKLIMEVY